MPLALAIHGVQAFGSSMKFICYEKHGETRAGRLDDDGQVTQIFGGHRDCTTLALAAEDVLAMAPEPDGRLSELRLCPPVLRPEKVIALGRNYAAHAKEGGADVPDFPMLFHKTATSLLAPGGQIVIPDLSDQIDYEAELAIIIGRRGKHIAESDAMQYIAGFTCANDISARDLQKRTGQFASGKMLDTFCPLGPVLVTPDELDPFGGVQNLRIQTRLNGETMQDSTTANMIFPVAFTVHYISQLTTLLPGDVILTGTPAGVGKARTPPVWLKSGDQISVEIEGIGILSNEVVHCSEVGPG